LDESEGVCDLHSRGVSLPIEGTELEYEEGSLYTQFYDMKVREILFYNERKLIMLIFTVSTYK